MLIFSPSRIIFSFSAFLCRVAPSASSFNLHITICRIMGCSRLNLDYGHLVIQDTPPSVSRSVINELHFDPESTGFRLPDSILDRSDKHCTTPSLDVFRVWPGSRSEP